MLRGGFAVVLALGVTTPAVAAQEGMTAAPRAGETILNCADGGWDVAGGTCRGRGGVVGTQQIGSGIGSSVSSFIVQPNAIFPDGGASLEPARRCGWANPCGE